MAITINGTGSITGISAGGLPDGVITTDDIAANAVTYAKIGTTEQGQLCKAWVNFNGTGTVAIGASYNVSSITDNGTGDYTVNFTTALADANYSAVLGTLPISTNDTRGIIVAIQGAYATGPTSMTASGVRIATGSGVTLNQLLDTYTICVAIFR